MTVAAGTEKPGVSRLAVPVAGVVAGLLCIVGVFILLDPNGGQNLLASIYDALGNSSGATELRNGQGDQALAKILLALIALGVGVGGIWLLYLGVGALVGMLRPGLAGSDPAVGVRRPGPDPADGVPAVSGRGDRGTQLLR